MLAFSFFMLAGLMAIGLVLERKAWKSPRWFSVAALAAVSIGAGVILWPGALIIQRGITALLMPIGVVWLALIVLTLWAWRRRQTPLAMAALAILLLLTVAGNRAVSKWACDRVEGSYQRIDPLKEPACEAIVLLGGGAGRGPEGQLNVSSSGDRLVTAARLYHAGKTRRIVCTGRAAGKHWPEDRAPSRMSLQLLRDLGVPSEALVLLGGRNTKEEMQVISLYLGEAGTNRIGLVTSAWHMPRAIRLAKAARLNFVPLPGDFRGGEIHWRDYSLLPESGALDEMGMIMKEIIARLAGR